MRRLTVVSRNEMIRPGSSGNLPLWRGTPRLHVVTRYIGGSPPAAGEPSAIPGPRTDLPRTWGHHARCAGLLEVENHESLRQRPDSGHDRVGGRYHGLRRACQVDLAPRQEAAATLSGMPGCPGAKIRHGPPAPRPLAVIAAVAPGCPGPSAARKAATTFPPPSLLRRRDPRGVADPVPPANIVNYQMTRGLVR